MEIIEMPTASSAVNIWYTRCGAATASALAIRNNALHAEFSDDAIVLHSLKDSADPDIRAAHYHHRLGGLFREGGNIPPIWARSNGADTAVIGITWLDEYQGILSRADGPIRNIGDLRGKRLALPKYRNLIDFQRGAALHGFVTALELEGIDPSEVQFVDVPATQGQQTVTPLLGAEAEALLAGKVDAIFLRFARGLRIARDARFHEVLNLNTLDDPLLRVNNGTPRPITVDRAFLSEHPDLVARYLSVLLRTSLWAAEHPSEVIALLSADSPGSSAADIVASHGNDVHRAFTPTLSAEYVQGLEKQKNFLRDWNFLGADFDIDDWIVSQPLAEAHALVERQIASAPSASLVRKAS
jgi:ABC-type nitrate/sulfonate/bicarbonate transport system substrate-binding protein